MIACGFLNTAASSGSVVTLPVMIFLGLDPATANATNRLPVLAGAFSGALDFASRKSMRWRTAFRQRQPRAPAGAKRYVFVLLVVAISAELIQLAWHYIFQLV